MKLADIKQRFEMMTAARLTRERTRRVYWNAFKAFDECEGLRQYTRKQLAGGKGRELLIRHYRHISERSRSFVMAGIKKVWTRGLGLPWPLEKDDLPRPPRPRRGSAPRREFVEGWVKAARDEQDLYEKSWVLVELNGGLRPIDQQAELKIEDLVFNAADEPIGIFAEAAKHGFKRDADIRMSFPKEVTDVVKAYLKCHPVPKSTAYVWPWRDRNGAMNAGRMASDRTVERMRRNFATRHRLPWLTSKDMRHFVRTVLNDSGMPIVERHYWQGHTPSPGNMDEQYGDRPPEETLEVQRRYLPQGVLGTFLRGGPVTDGVPPEVRDVWSGLVAGELDSLEAVDALRDLVRKARQRQTVAEIITP